MNPDSPIKTLNGWVRYPLPDVASFACKGMYVPSGATKIDLLLKEALGKNGDQLKNVLRENSLRSLVAQLRTAKKDEVPVLVLAVWLSLRAQEKKFESKQMKAYSDRFRSLLVPVKAFLCECLSSRFCDSDCNSAFYLSKRLYPLHALEVAIFQQRSNGNCLYQDSLAMLLLQAKQEFASQRQPASTESINESQRVLLALGGAAFSSHLAAGWRKFVILHFSDQATARRSQEDNAFFSDLLRCLDELGIFTLWLHSSFASKADFSELIKEFDGCRYFIKELLKKNDEMRSYDSNRCADPKTFMAAWQELMTFKDYFSSSSFCDKCKGLLCADNNLLAKNILSEILLKFVDLFDQSIKALTRSQNFKIIGGFGVDGRTVDEVVSNADQIRTFFFMVKNYGELLKSILNIILKGPSMDVYFLVPPGGTSLASSFCSLLEKRALYAAMRSAQDSTHLDVGKVDLSLWRIDVPHHFLLIEDGREDGVPSSYEAIFTIIHTSLKTLLATLQSDRLPELAIPQDLRSIQKEVERESILASIPSSSRACDLDFSPRYSGFSFNQEKLELRYFLPLRDHSGDLRIMRSRKGSISILFSVFGDDECSANYVTDGRWHEMMAYASYYAHNLSNGLAITSQIAPDFKSFTVEVSMPEMQQNSQVNYESAVRVLLERLAFLSYTSHRDCANEFSHIDDFLAFYEWMRAQKEEVYSKWFYDSGSSLEKYVRNHFFRPAKNLSFIYPYYFDGQEFFNVTTFLSRFSLRCSEKLSSLSRTFFELLFFLREKECNSLAERVVLFSLSRPECIVWSEIEWWSQYDFFLRKREGVDEGRGLEVMRHWYGAEKSSLINLSACSDSCLSSFVEGIIVSPLLRRLMQEQLVGTVGGALKERLLKMADSFLGDTQKCNELFAEKSWLAGLYIKKNIPQEFSLGSAPPLQPLEKKFLSPEDLSEKITSAKLALGLADAIERK